MTKKTALILAASIILVSLILKTFFVLSMDTLPLKGDAPGFVKLAGEMSYFYASSVREPLWILFVKTCSFFDAKTALRLAAVIISGMSAFLIFFIVLKITDSPLEALSSGAFFSFIPYLFYSPVRAHRFELYLFLMLLNTFYVLYMNRKLYSYILFALFASMLLLVRTEAFIVVFALLIYSFHRNRPKLLFTLPLFLLVLLSMTAPFYHSCYRDKGSYFYILDKHSRFYAAHELSVEKGILSEEEALSDPYADEDTGIKDYLFRMRSPMELVRKVLKGYRQALEKASLHLLSVPVDLKFLIFPVWAGLLYMLISRKRRILLFFGLLYIFPHSLILSTRLAGHSSVDIRFAAVLAGLMSFAAGASVFAFKLLINKLTDYFKYLSVSTYDKTK